jgi:hypothetical protein
MKIIISLLISLFYLSAAADESATSTTEKLNYFVPEGFKIIYQHKDSSGEIIEIISASETLENWSRMITIQTFTDGNKYDPEKFILDISRLAKDQCGSVQVEPVTTAQQNGFFFSHKVIMCSPNIKTDKAEIMNIKAIKGKDSFFVAQVINRVEIDENEIRYWAIYLRDLVIENK